MGSWVNYTFPSCRLTNRLPWRDLIGFTVRAFAVTPHLLVHGKIEYAGDGHYCVDRKVGYVVTHGPTGCTVPREPGSRFPAMFKYHRDAVAFAKLVAPLTDWNRRSLYGLRGKPGSKQQKQLYAGLAEAGEAIPQEVPSDD